MATKKSAKKKATKKSSVKKSKKPSSRKSKKSKLLMLPGKAKAVTGPSYNEVTSKRRRKDLGQYLATDDQVETFGVTIGRLLVLEEILNRYGLPSEAIDDMGEFSSAKDVMDFLSDEKAKNVKQGWLDRLPRALKILREDKSFYRGLRAGIAETVLEQ